MRENDRNLPGELAGLLEFVAEVAIAIRSNSTYGSRFRVDPHTAAHDVRWLADSLHNLNMLGRAIQEERNVVFACDQLIAAYEWYDTGEPKAVFERYPHVRLDEARSLFRSIRARASVEQGT